jgi:hypothetical protein
MYINRRRIERRIDWGTMFTSFVAYFFNYFKNKIRLTEDRIWIDPKMLSKLFCFFHSTFYQYLQKEYNFSHFREKKRKKKPATSLLTTGIPKNVVSYVRIFVFS